MGRVTKTKSRKSATPPSHPKYEDMIRDAIVALKERKGSSRQAIKKYILTTFKLPDNTKTTSQLKLAIHKGVDKGVFAFPNGPNGTIKLVKKEPAKKEKKDDKPKKEKKEKKESKPKVEKKPKKTVVKKTPAKKATTKSPRKTIAKGATKTAVKKPAKKPTKRTAKTTSAEATS
ncbi:5036_t:CDS:2 [Paraglomus occultum]|uniref:Histone H1 n=1 Tax=Paraglomus occultum TaxID=144539 RepID=A0A9N9AKK1_9GLOM|nr:5036_t:CDS:2 [Paraglomus occultum]